MTELWLRDPLHYAEMALSLGFKRFSWQIPQLLNSGADALSWMRAAAIGYGETVELMLIDFSGAAVYNIFDSYARPRAVYPTWTPEDSIDQLKWLMQNNVADDPEFTEDATVEPMMRPVPGQKHMVVVHRIGKSSDPMQRVLMLHLRDLQRMYPQCELFISGLLNYSTMFDYGFGAVDHRPICLTDTGSIYKYITLPTGKGVKDYNAYDPRYKDWFSLVGYSQEQLRRPDDFLEFSLLSLKWAERNFKRITPFVIRVNGKPIPYVPNELKPVSDKDFILPAGRRRLMRNLGLHASELDQFQCDTCILQNACTLFRQGAVCTVKGSDTVDLAKNFGTRDAQAIIGGLGKLLAKQMDRLEQAQVIEDASGELDPEVTRMYRNIFDQGVKLAKLIDPNLAKTTDVNVNIGGVPVQQAVAQADPRQLIASVVAELEDAGIPRDQITSKMVKGVLEGMGVNGEVGKRQAITAAAVKAGKVLEV